MPGWAEAAGFVLLALVFVWAVLDVVALARSVLLHALNRTRQAELNEL
jgi:hypothetical protein